jgi:multiple sugar transport system substrate-binding protein
MALSVLSCNATSQAFKGYTLKVKLIEEGPSDLLYAAVIPGWEKRTGATVKILAKNEMVRMVEDIKQDVANRTVDFCLASNHTSFNAQFDNLYRDLSELLPASHLLHFNAHVLEMSKVDGKLLQLPHYSDISGVFYNKSLYASADNKAAYKARYHKELRPPLTWAEFAQQAKFFTRAPDLYGTQFAGKSEPLTGRFYEMLIAEGGQLLDKNWRPAFNSPAGLRALNYFVDLYQSGAVPKNTPNLGWNDLGQAFASGHIALNLDWAGWARYYNDPKTSRIAGQVGILRAPKGSGGKRTGWSGSHSFSITKSCDNPAAAADFLMALTSLDAQLLEARQGKLVARLDAAAIALDEFRRSGDRYMSDTMVTFSTSMAEDAFTPPLTPEWVALSDALWPQLQKAITGEISQKEALKQAEKDVLSLMQESGRLR